MPGYTPAVCDLLQHVLSVYGLSLLMQTVTVAGSSSTTVGSDDQTSCLPNFLRFCEAISTSSSGQQCPSISFRRPAKVFPSITNQVNEALLQQAGNFTEDTGGCNAALLSVDGWLQQMQRSTYMHGRHCLVDLLRRQSSIFAYFTMLDDRKLYLCVSEAVQRYVKHLAHAACLSPYTI